VASKDLTFNIFGRDRGASSAIRGVGKASLITQKNVAQASRGIGIGMGIATAAIVAFGASSVKAFIDAETQQNKLLFAYEKFPALADASLDSLRTLNSELAKTTKYDDDATAGAQAVLAQFKLTGKQIIKLTPLVQDYASATGKDLPSAAEDLGKALLGQGRALKAVGINFKDLGDPTANFEELISSLSTAVGGFAAKEGKTAAGQALILQNRFGEFQETIGGSLLPGLLQLADVFGEKLMPKLEQFGGWFSSPEVQDSLAGFMGWVSQGIEDLPTFAGTIAGATVAAWGLSLALDANPIGLFVIAVGLAIVQWNIWSKVVNDNIGIIAGSWGFFEAAAINAIGGVMSAINDLLGGLNLILDGISAITGIPIATIRLPEISATAHSTAVRPDSSAGGRKGGKVTKFADGGIAKATPGGIYGNFAEAGVDEAVIPLTARNMAMLGGGGGGTYITVNVPKGFIGSTRQLSQGIRRTLDNGGKLGAIPKGAN